jgi:outer membrane protein TolC
MVPSKTNLTKTYTVRSITYSCIGIIAFLFFSIASDAQRTAATDTSKVIEEKLVALALNGPAMKALEHRAKIDEYTLKNAQNQWTNLLTFSLNYNDLSFAKQSTVNTVAFPKYFFGLNIPLGTLLSRTQIKSARESIEIGKTNQEELRRAIRAQVLTKYAQYKTYNELITIQSELINDVQAQLIQTEEKFRKGTVTIETYTAAQNNKNNETARLINLRLEQQLVKIDLERMIGTSLESVIR